MADFTKDMMADAAADNPGTNMGKTGSLRDVDWGAEEPYWAENFGSRPYATADRGFDYYRPAYQYGHEAAARLQGRPWEEVEPDLARGWDEYRGESRSKWEDIKEAVRDAWDRTVGRIGGNSGIDWENRERGLGGPEKLRDRLR